MTNNPIKKVPSDTLVMKSHKSQNKFSHPWETQAPGELGKYVQQDVEEVKRMGWNIFVVVRWGQGDFVELDNLLYPERGTLRQ